MNWIREYVSPVTWASERAVSVFATPGRSSSRTWPSAMRPSTTSSSTARLPMTARSSSSTMAPTAREASAAARSSALVVTARPGPRADIGRRGDGGQEFLGIHDPRRAGEERVGAGSQHVHDGRRVLGPVQVEAEGGEAGLRSGVAGRPQPRRQRQAAAVSRHRHEREVAGQLGHALRAPDRGLRQARRRER